MTGHYKDIILRHIKNSFGWSTTRKLVVFTVDDYGSIRIASREARDKLISKGIRVESNKFDMFDALEDDDDLTQLFEVLSSVKDRSGNNAIFTAMTLPANPDFEQISSEAFLFYRYECLPETWKKLPGYEGMGKLWQQGISNRLIHPQFHGREHLNIRALMQALHSGDSEAINYFENKSIGTLSKRIYSTINPLAAFDFEKFDETEAHKNIISDGLNAFEKVFGYRALHFASPGNREHRSLASVLQEGGITYLDSDMIRTEHQGNGKYTRSVDYTGKQNKYGQFYLVRNVVFEPSANDSFDWVGYCLKQIEIAFLWNKPAIISTHRVNFSGHIEPKNRERGLSLLSSLLKEILKHFPDSEFMTTVDLGELIRTSA